MEIQQIESEIKKLDEELTLKEQKDRLLEMKKKETGPTEIISSIEYSKTHKHQYSLFKAYTGFPTIDHWIDGFKPGTVNVISGATKEGKTTFCQSLTVNFTKSGFACLWFSLDTPAIELIERFKKIPLFYLPKDTFAEKKVDWIEQKVMEGLAKFNTRIIFIDNLEFMTIYDEKSGRNYAGQLGDIVIKLKNIATRWNVVIFLNHHISKVDRTVAFPSYHDLKDSSGVAAHSDTVFMVSRGRIKTSAGWDIVDGYGTIKLELQRNGGHHGSVQVIFKDNLLYEKSSKIETTAV